MRLDRITIALRPRTPWEAMDLGQALVRRHAAAIWRPWLALTLPPLLLFNALAWWSGTLWWAAVFMWWLKPVFDRVPLYVLSRAVFGSVPNLRETLRAPELWAGRQWLAWLTWRRLHPARALLLPVDMLEGLHGPRRRVRVSVLQRAISSQAFGLIFACSYFEVLMFASVWVLALMFVPQEFLSESARAVWATFFEHPPLWAQATANAVLWLSSSLIEPFYVGAGFGLYLNRRTQLESWDVELAFRRLADRARQSSPLALAALLLIASSVSPGSAQAAAGKSFTKPAAAATSAEARSHKLTPAELFGSQWQAHDNRFDRAVDRAYLDPLLSPKQTITQWVPNDKRTQAQPKNMPWWLQWLSGAMAFVGEYGLWLLAIVLLGFLLWRAPRWLTWARARIRGESAPSAITEQAIERVEALPADIPTAVHTLWQTQRRREALALLYRASVERIAQRLGTPFPPGATEAECLRRARKLPGGEMQTLFTRVVRTWQAAAYAQRLPESSEVDELLRAWSRGFAPEAP
jgi:hypothetical protein